MVEFLGNMYEDNGITTDDVLKYRIQGCLGVEMPCIAHCRRDYDSVCRRDTSSCIIENSICRFDIGNCRLNIPSCPTRCNICPINMA